MDMRSIEEAGAVEVSLAPLEEVMDMMTCYSALGYSVELDHDHVRGRSFILFKRRVWVRVVSKHTIARAGSRSGYSPSSCVPR
jgi:hypothetical protein